MQNDVLKNQIAPWQEKGRWYKGTYKRDANGISIDTDKSDKFLIDVFLVSGVDFRVATEPNRVLCTIYDPVTKPGSTFTLTRILQKVVNGAYWLTIPTTIDEFIIYLFIV